jgi:autotransporter-associated beta strand protein
MTIKQSTDKASLNWNSFSVGQDASVNVQQNNANSVLLNRVVGNEASQIFGKISANGQMVLINQNGIVFGKSGSVTSSAFTASTFNLSDDDFANGNYNYVRNGSKAGITNQGSIIATEQGGYIALIGANVSNEGSLKTVQGPVIMTAGDAVALPSAMTSNIQVPLSRKVRLELLPSTINAMVANTESGVITTDGGQVLMHAAAVSDAVANISANVVNSGKIDTTGAQGGAVTLRADDGYIKVNGSITANSTGNTNNQTNKGGDIIIGRDEQTDALAYNTDVTKAKLESTRGFVETSAKYLDFGGVDVKAGHWLLDPYNITIGTSEANSISTSLNATAGTTVTVTTAASGLGSTGAGDGNITVSSNILKNAGNTSTLELIADNGITINNGISIKGTSASGGLNVKLVSKGTTTNTNNSINSRGINLSGSIDTNGTVVIDSTTKLTGGPQHIGGSALWISGGSVLRGTDVNVTLNVDPTSANRVYGLFAQNNATIEATAGDVFVSSTLKNSQPSAGFYAQSLLFGSGTGALAAIKATGNITLKSDTSASTNNVNTGGISLVDARLQAGGNISVESIVGSNGMNAIGSGNGGSGLGFSAISTGTNGTISFKSNQGTIGVNNLISPTTGVAGLSAKDITIDNGTGAAAGVTGVTISGAGGVSATNSLTINATGAGTALDNSASINNATLATYNLSGTGIQSGVISGAGAVNKTGSGNLTLSVANTHSGTTTVTAGTLTLGNVNALQSSTLDTGTSGTQQVAFSVAGNNTYNIGSLQGIDDLAIGTNTISVGAIDAANTTKTYSGAITGTGGFRKIGAGTQVLALSNSSYTGGTTVNGGTLKVTAIPNFKSSTIAIAANAIFEANTAANANWAAQTNVSGDGTFKKTGQYALTTGASNGNFLRFGSNANGLIDIQEGTLQNDWGRAELSNNLATINIANGAQLDIRNNSIQMRGLTGLGNIISTYNTAATPNITVGIGASSSDTYVYSGVIGAIQADSTKLGGNPVSPGNTNFAFVKNNTNTQVLSGNNLYAGTTTVNGGTLQIGNGSNSGTLGTGNVTLASTANLNFNRNDNSYVVANNINGSTSGVGTVNQNGTGTTTLIGTNTYGATNISAGTLQIGNGGSAGTLGTGAVAIATNANLTINRSNALTLNNTISGTGNINFTGTGNANESIYGLSATNSGFSGNLNITKSRLTIGNANTVGNAKIAVSNGGTLYAVNTTLSNTLSLGGIGWADSHATGSSYIGALRLENATYNGDITLTADARIGGYTSGGGTVSGLIKESSGGPKNLEINATSGYTGGTVVLTKDNTYTGTTTINTGTLQLGNNSTTGNIASSSAIVNNGNLTINRSNSVNIAQNITGTGSLTQAGSTGITILTGTNSYGATTINAGTLQIGDGASTGATAGTGSLGTGTVTDNANLVFNRSNSMTVANNISGSGAVKQMGTGTTILTGTNSYGDTTITAGTLQIGDGSTNGATAGMGTLGSGVVTVGTGANLNFNRSSAITVANTISGPGKVSQNGSGAGTASNLTLTGDVSGATGVFDLNYGQMTFDNLNSNRVFNGSQININNKSTLNINGNSNTNWYSFGTTFNFDSLGGGSIAIANPNFAGGWAATNKTVTFKTNGGLTNMITGNGINLSSGQQGINALFNIKAGENGAAGLDYSAGFSQGPGPITKTGAGTMLLTNDSTNAQNITYTINQGILQVGNSDGTGFLGAGDVTLSANANLNFARTVNTKIENKISGNGNVNANITGTLEVANAINLTTAGNTVNLQTSGNITESSGNMTATNLYLSSTNGNIGTSGQRIQSNVNNLSLSSKGNQFVTQAIDANVAAVTTTNGNGSVDIKTTNGTITVATVNGITGINADGTGNVVLAANGSNKDVIINNAINSVAGEVNILASRNISVGADITTSGNTFLQATTGSISGAANVAANKLAMTAGSTIGTINSRLKTNVTNIGVSAGSDVYVTEANDITVAGKTTTNGSLFIETTNGVLTVDQFDQAPSVNGNASGFSGASSPSNAISGLVANGNGKVVLTAKGIAKDVVVNQTVTSGSGEVNILASGNLNVRADIVTKGNAFMQASAGTISGTGTLAATNLALTAGSGIGTSAARLNTNVAGLGISAGGDVFVTEANAVTVAGKTTNNGSLDIQASNGTLDVKTFDFASTVSGNAVGFSTVSGTNLTGLVANGSGGVTLVGSDTTSGSLVGGAPTGGQDGVTITNTVTAGTKGISITGTSKNRVGVAFRAGSAISGGDLTIKGYGTNRGGVYADDKSSLQADGVLSIEGRTTNNLSTDNYAYGVAFESNSSITANNKTSSAISILGELTHATGGTSTRGAVNLGGSITNNSTGGGATNIAATFGNIYAFSGITKDTSGVTTYDGMASITSAASAGKISITAGTDIISNGSVDFSIQANLPGWGAQAKLTVTQNSAAGVEVSSTGQGHVVAPLVVNNGAGNVVIAAGTAINAGTGTGGQVKATSNSTDSLVTQNSTGKTYIYSGNLTDTGSLNKLDNALMNLYATAVDSNLQSLGSNQAYGYTIANGANAQVIFRDKINLGDVDFSSTVTKTYGDTGYNKTAFNNGASQLKTDTANALAVLSSTDTVTKNLSNSAASSIKFKKSALIQQSNLSSDNWTDSDFSTSGNLKAYTGTKSFNISRDDFAINTSGNANLQILTKTIMVSDITVNRKTYDGTMVASLTDGSSIGTVAAGSSLASDNKFVAGDNVALTGTATGTYNSKDVTAQNNTVTFNGKTLSKADANVAADDTSNYNLVQQASANGSGTITAKTITVSGIAVNSKTYDGTKVASLSDGSSVSTVDVGSSLSTDNKFVAGDNVALTGTAAGTYTSKDVTAQNNTVTFNGKTLSKANATLTADDTSNYNLVQQASANGSGTITAKTITVSGIAVNSKTYDGTKVASLSDGSSVSTVDVGSSLSTDNKFVAGDNVALTGTAAGTYTSKDVTAQNNTVTFNGKTLSKANATLTADDTSNYNLVQQASANGSGTITAKTITVSGIAVNSKTYDGTKVASLTDNSSVSIVDVGSSLATDNKFVAGDNVALTGTATGTYNSKDVTAQNNTVTFSGKTLSKANATLTADDTSNYNLVQQASANGSGTITAKTITSDVFQPAVKSYDGSTKATTSVDSTNQVLTTDDVKIKFDETSPTYDSAVIGTGKKVTITGVALSGSDASNYRIASTVETKKNTINAASPTAPVRTPAVTTSSSSKSAKAGAVGANPFQLASAEVEVEEDNVCSTSSAASCKCESSSSAPGVSICYSAGK